MTDQLLAHFDGVCYNFFKIKPMQRVGFPLEVSSWFIILMKL